jgi:hypothetical protein
MHLPRRARVLLMTSLLATSVVAASPQGSALADVTFGLQHSSHSSNADRPVVTGPVTAGSHGFAFSATSMPLSLYGYTEKEYFYSGVATSYSSAAPLTSDGNWTVRRASTEPYKTRMLVRQPANPKKFNGTVIVEWLNVSVGFDTTPEWAVAHNELLRDGYAWVGVSAQAIGVNGAGGKLATTDIGAGLKGWDPTRYGSLLHPGDSFSYDIFSQAGQALRKPIGAQPLRGLHVRNIIAAGESQSAIRLTTYIDAVAPLARVYDGYLVHSRSGTGAPLSQAPQAVVQPPTPTRFRTDLRVPVLTFQSESDLMWLNYVAARQPDTSMLRDWETAGTPHADRYHLAFDTDVDTQKSLPWTRPNQECGKPINDGPMRYVLGAAYVALTDWVRSGVPAPSAPRIATTSASQPTIIRDSHGIALGGIRTPDVDVPVATLSGEGNSADCVADGSTIAFTPDQIASLYPSSADYVGKVTADALAAVDKGFLLKDDAKAIVEKATWFRLGDERAGCCNWK